MSYFATTPVADVLKVYIMLLLLGIPSIAKPDRLFFTSEICSDYGHAIAQSFVQKLYNGAFRTVGNIHLEESRERNGNKKLVLFINGTARINYPYSLSRRSLLLPESEVAENLINQLISDKKAIKTKK